MKREELKELFMLSNTELNNIVLYEDMVLLKKKYRDALKVYHPDNINSGDSSKFRKLRKFYGMIETSGIGNVVDSQTNGRILVNIDEMRSNLTIIKDVNGTEWNKKDAIKSDLWVQLLFKITVDGVEYYGSHRCEYRLDNRFNMEFRPKVNRDDFYEKEKHCIKVEIINTSDCLTGEINWSGRCKDLTLSISGDKLIVKPRINIQLTVEEGEGI